MRANSQRGFTLIEVVVALAIMALSLAATFSLFSVSLKSSAVAGELAAETSLAKSLMALLDAQSEIEIGDDGGTLEGGYRWQRRISEWGNLPTRPDGATILPVEVVVKVWHERRGDAGITLTTTRLMAFGQPPAVKS